MNKSYLFFLPNSWSIFHTFFPSATNAILPSPFFICIISVASTSIYIPETEMHPLHSIQRNLFSAACLITVNFLPQFFPQTSTTLMIKSKFLIMSNKVFHKLLSVSPAAASLTILTLKMHKLGWTVQSK